MNVRRHVWGLVRMVGGSVLGIVGFGTLSMGFVHLSGSELLVGLIEVLGGAFLALGVLSPLRKHKTPS